MWCRGLNVRWVRSSSDSLAAIMTCMSATLDYNSILQTVTKWPPEQRASLAHELLATLRPAPGERPTIDELTGVARPETVGPNNAVGALGLFSGPTPPPDDDDVTRMIHEHRMEKYGR